MFKKICIGNDHGGYEAKTMIVEHLQKAGVEVVDVGSGSGEIVRYPHYAAKVCGAVQRGEAQAGILICSTGIGMSIIANKFRGIRAALCTSGYMAKMTRRHNNSNVLCLGGKVTGIFEILDIVDTWVCEEFEGGRHSISLAMIAAGEEEMIKATGWLPPQDLDPSKLGQSG